ncbi:hypothetical protein FH5_04062 [Priestia endophytica]|nr:hypothetical protein FH5_04062 [Priestia endophytica]
MFLVELTGDLLEGIVKLVLFLTIMSFILTNFMEFTYDG